LKRKAKGTKGRLWSFIGKRRLRILLENCKGHWGEWKEGALKKKKDHEKVGKNVRPADYSGRINLLGDNAKLRGKEVAKSTGWGGEGEKKKTKEVERKIKR